MTLGYLKKTITQNLTIQMNQLQLPAIITSLRSKVDGSLGLSLVTPELSNQAKLAFFELQNKNIDITIVPIDYENAPVIKIDKEIQTKTPCQRARNVLYLVWKQGSDKPFEEFYNIRMEEVIERLKGELDI